MSNKAATSSSSSMRTEEDMIEDHPPISCAPSGTELKKGNTFFISAADKHTHTHTRAHTLIPDTPRKVDSFITAHMKQSHSSTSTHTHTDRSHGGCSPSSLLYTLTTAVSKYSLTVSHWTFWLLVKLAVGPKGSIRQKDTTNDRNFCPECEVDRGYTNKTSTQNQ